MKSALLLILVLQFLSVTSLALDDQRIFLNPQHFKTEVLKELQSVKVLAEDVHRRLQDFDQWENREDVEKQADLICDMHSVQAHTIYRFTGRMSLVNDAWQIKNINEENIAKASHKMFYNFDSIEQLSGIDEIVRLMGAGFCMEVRADPIQNQWNQAEVDFLDGPDLIEHQQKIIERLGWWQNHLKSLDVTDQAHVDLTDALIYMDLPFEDLSPFVQPGFANKGLH